MADTIGKKVKNYTYGSSNYELHWDKHSGRSALYRVDRVGLKRQRIPVFESGLLNSEGKNDPNLNDGGNIKSHVFSDMQKDIAKAYDNEGGRSNGANVESWVSEGNRLIANSDDLYRSKRLNSGVSIELDDYGRGDEFFGGGLSAQYPIDALYSTVASDSGDIDGVVRGGDERQDHLNISQYKYKVPRSEALFGKEAQKNKKNLLTSGIVRNSPLKKFLGLVKLPMPNDITDSNNVAWGEDRMNAIEAAGIAEFGNPGVGDILAVGSGAVGGWAAGDVKAGAGAGVIGKILWGLDGRQLREAYGAEATSRTLAMAGIDAPAQSILARGKGVIPNSNLELLFQGPMLREFQFIYKMSPRSKNEANVVNQIVRFFKQGMAAKKLKQTSGDGGGGSFFLGTPNVFRLQYRTTNNDAPHGVNRMKTCALTGTSINYTPEGAWAAYEGGQPVSILMTLRFQELEPIYDTDYSVWGRGNSLNWGKDSDMRTSDTDLGNVWPIRSNEVGY